MAELSSPQHKAIRAVAYFEACKGLLAIAAASGLLALLHKDVADFALRMVHLMHLNPASHYPSIFIDAASRVGDSRLWLLAVGAAFYSMLRLGEAYGLYYEKTWAEVVAAASGAIYVPFEVLGLLHHPNLLHATLLAVNLAIVALMLYALWQRRKTG
jgi:uncharacterized membrane protein (DUF2068 family)